MLDKPHEINRILDRRIICRIFTRSTMAITVDRKHVIALRQFPEHRTIVLPRCLLTVDQHERRTIVRPLTIVNDRTTRQHHLPFNKTNTTNNCLRSPIIRHISMSIISHTSSEQTKHGTHYYQHTHPLSLSFQYCHVPHDDLPPYDEQPAQRTAYPSRRAPDQCRQSVGAHHQP